MSSDNNPPILRPSKGERPSTSDQQALLALLQIADSAFPSGSFTHSYGLEQIIREGIARRPEEVTRLVASVIRGSAATADAPAAYAAASAAMDADLDAIAEIDRALYATKAAAELRQATLQTGRRLIEEVSLHVEDATLSAYRCAIADDERLGCQPVAFGVAAAALGVSPGDVPSALLYAAAGALFNAAMRLTRFSHRDVQAGLHALRPVIADLALQAQATARPRLLSFHPLQEIAAMRHQRAEARLFAS